MYNKIFLMFLTLMMGYGYFFGDVKDLIFFGSFLITISNLCKNE